MRDDIGELIGVVSRIREIEDLALTTNGVLLPEKLDSIVNSRIKRVNVSLPSLDSSRYREITKGRIDRVIEAIKVLLTTQIRVKINMVAYGDEALEELKRCIDFISDKDVELRFIEYMPVCSSTYHHDKFISAERIERLLVDVYGFSPEESKTHTVSRIYTRPDLLGRIGLIMPVSNQFCDSCNKVRINCYGELRPCLFSDKKINILEIVKRSPFEQALERLLNFMNLNFTRPDIKSILSGENVSSVRMVETGG
jgi:cyclic pyranopterin phosphate synthase